MRKGCIVSIVGPFERNRPRAANGVIDDNVRPLEII